MVYQDDLGLNEIASQYEKNTYEELVFKGGTELFARKPLVEKVDNGKVIQEREIHRARVPVNATPADLGLYNPENPTKITITPPSVTDSLVAMLPSVFGTILMVVLFVWLLGRLSAGAGGMGGPMAFIRSRARVYDPEADERVTFSDVAGSEEEKEDLAEVVDFLKSPEKYRSLGAKIPRGILLQ